MDRAELKEKTVAWLKNQKMILLALAVGIFLMTFPVQKVQETEIPEETITKQPELQEALAEILSHVSGAGKVEVLLTYAEGEEAIYQLDEDISSDDIRRDTILITNANREETGLIRQINPPVYRGAVILCQGADKPAVRLSLVQAVMSVTGLTSDHITVLKMK